MNKEYCDCGICSYCNGCEGKNLTEDLSGTILFDIVDETINSNIQNLIDKLPDEGIDEIIILNELRESLGIIKIAAKHKPNNPKLWAKCIAEAKRKFDVFPCVPISNSFALTEFGWKKYNEILPGDRIISYNIKLDKLEYDLVNEIHFYNNAKTIQVYYDDNFSFVCTPDHKIVVKNQKKAILSKAITLNKNCKLVTHSKFNDEDMVKDINPDSFIIKVLNMTADEKAEWLKTDKRMFIDNFSFEEFEICSTLLGLNANVEKNNEGELSLSTCEPRQIKTKDLVIKKLGLDDVWCPVTKNKTWVMKQGNIITITGNSAYANGYAAKIYKKKGGTWKTIKNKKK
jgi:hypothetical protein